MSAPFAGVCWVWNDAIPHPAGVPDEAVHSYGHDEHQDFVRRIVRDLTEHSCWIDSERIHEQPD